MREGLAVSLDQAKPAFVTRTGTSVSTYYGQGLNFDRDLDQFRGVVDWTITDALTSHCEQVVGGFASAALARCSRRPAPGSG